MIGLYPLIRRGTGPLRGALCTVLPVAAASATVACGFYLLVPKVDMITVFRRWRNYELMRAMEGEARNGSLAGETFLQVKQRLEGIFARSLEPGSGRELPLLFEDSPGNWTLVEDERGIVFCAYDDAGFPLEVVLRPRAAQPQ